MVVVLDDFTEDVYIFGNCGLWTRNDDDFFSVLADDISSVFPNGCHTTVVGTDPCYEHLDPRT